MKFSITIQGNPRDPIMDLVNSNGGSLLKDEKTQLVAVFSSKNWKVSQHISFEWFSDGKNTQLAIESTLAPPNQILFKLMVGICTIFLPVLAIVCYFNAINVLYQILLTIVLLSLSIIVGATFLLHGKAVERLVRYLAVEFDKRNIRWLFESDKSSDELKTPMFVAGAVIVVMAVVLVFRSVMPLPLLVFSLGLFLIILSEKSHTHRGISLWKFSLLTIFMCLALLASFPSIYWWSISFIAYNFSGTESLITVFYALFVLFFAGIVLPQSINTQEKIFGKSFWVGARREYQQALEKTQNEIRTREYFEKLLGLNLMIFSSITVICENFWYVLLGEPGILMSLFFLRIIILSPLFILVYSWIQRSLRSLLLYTRVKEPSPRTRTIAAQIFEELYMRNVQVKSYESILVNGSAVYFSPFSSKGFILLSSGAEKKLDDTELKCLILHECGHIVNDSSLMRLLKVISQFSPLGESLFALSVDMMRVEERSDMFATIRIGKDNYSKFLLRVSVINTLKNIRVNEPPLVHCFLPPFFPEKAKRGLKGLYEMYKGVYSIFFGGGIVGYIHPSISRRIKTINSREEASTRKRT